MTIIIGLVLVCLLVAIGYVVMTQNTSDTPQTNATATPSATPQTNNSSVFGVGDNGKTVTVNNGSTFSVVLNENPSVGYSWNASTTSGLNITNDEYIRGASNTGASGNHEWTITASGNGSQQFTAIYKRPWEPTTGNESAFILKVTVV